MDTPIFEKKNVLVTGGAGFLGSHLCEFLLRDSKVICLDNFSNSDPGSITHLLQYPDFEFINYDVNKPIDLDQFDELDKFKVKFQGIQEIYHLACPTSPKDFEKSKLQSLWSNSSAMINTLDLAVKYHAKYLFSSSAVVYGEDQGRGDRFAEDNLGVVNQLSERACYDEGKRFAETSVATYRQVYGIDAKIARVFTTYGPHMKLFDKQLIPDFIINAIDGKDLVIYGDESFSTSLCYVSDMVDGMARLMKTGPEINLANLGGEEAIRYADVAQMIISMTKSTSRLVFEKPLLFLTQKGLPNIAFAKDRLEWLPLVMLEDGLRKTIDYIIARRESLLFTNFGATRE